MKCSIKYILYTCPSACLLAASSWQRIDVDSTFLRSIGVDYSIFQDGCPENSFYPSSFDRKCAFTHRFFVHVWISVLFTRFHTYLQVWQVETEGRHMASHSNNKVVKWTYTFTERISHFSRTLRSANSSTCLLFRFYQSGVKLSILHLSWARASRQQNCKHRMT